MKALICTDVRLGSFCSENLEVKLSRKWQKYRTEALHDLFDIATQTGATYIAIFGQLFGQNRTSESVIDSLLDAIKEEKHIHFLIFVDQLESERVSYRNDLPENLHLMCTGSSDMYLDEDVAARIDKGVIELQFGDYSTVRVGKNELGAYCIYGIEGANEKEILSFEPTGYDDAQTSRYGYSVLEWNADKIISFVEHGHSRFVYETVEIKIQPEDSQREMLRKIMAAVSQFKHETFLRINLRGRSAFGLMINGNEIKAQLQNRLFHVEVFDSTVMDIDEESFNNDISLRSEFIRLALQDDSVSESERNRLICCGWNVLNGKEVPAE